MTPAHLRRALLHHRVHDGGMLSANYFFVGFPGQSVKDCPTRPTTREHAQ